LFYEPRFKHLWFQSLTKSQSYDHLADAAAAESKGEYYDEMASVSEVGSSVYIPNLKKSSTTMSSSTRFGKDLEGGRRGPSGAGGGGPGAGVGRRRRSIKDKMVLYTVNQNGVVEIVNIDNSSSYRKSTHDDNDLYISYPGYSAPSILEYNTFHLDTLSGPSGTANGAGTTTASTTANANAPPKDVRVIHELVEGPKYVCNPQWPNFTQFLPCREQVRNDFCFIPCYQANSSIIRHLTIVLPWSI
jgi:hypothetical protein